MSLQSRLQAVISAIAGDVKQVTPSSVSHEQPSTPVTPRGDVWKNLLFLNNVNDTVTIENPTGPSNDGSSLLIRITSGFNVPLIFGDGYLFKNGLLARPENSVIGTMVLGFMYRSDFAQWELIAISKEE